ncbi:Protein of unknown function, partial [Gryllus bimaculatus]
IARAETSDVSEAPFSRRSRRPVWLFLVVRTVVHLRRNVFSMMDSVMEGYGISVPVHVITPFRGSCAEKGRPFRNENKITNIFENIINNITASFKLSLRTHLVRVCYWLFPSPGESSLISNVISVKS